jgi:hypothetical protein
MLGTKPMALLFGLIAILAIVGLAVIAQSLPSSGQQIQAQQQPNTQNTTTNPEEAKSHEQKADNGTKTQKTKGYWERFVGFVETREKFITAFSTILMVLVTAAVAGSTYFLYSATKGLVAGTENTAQRQLRAYVGVGADDFGFDTPGENDPNYTPIDPANPVAGQIYKDFLTIKVKNFGQTPAYGVVVFGNLATTSPFAAMLPDDFFTARVPMRDVIPNVPIRPFTSRFILQPEQTAVSKHAIFDVRAITAARQRQISVYVWGRIYYRDIFERPWRTMFCYVWEPWHPPSPRFVPYETYNGEDQTPFE